MLLRVCGCAGRHTERWMARLGKAPGAITVVRDTSSIRALRPAWLARREQRLRGVRFTSPADPASEFPRHDHFDRLDGAAAVRAAPAGRCFVGRIGFCCGQ